MAVALVLLVVVLAGCGSDHGASGAGNAGPEVATAMTGGEVSPTSRDAARPSSTGDGVGSSTTDVDGSAGGPGSSLAASPDEPAVLAAVDCYWATIVEASNPPNPSHPGFDRCFTGEARSRSVELVRQRLDGQQHAVDPSGVVEWTELESTQLDEGRVVIRVCMVDDGILVDNESGVVLDDTVVTADMDLHVVRSNGVWLVADAVLIREVEARVSCDL